MSRTLWMLAVLVLCCVLAFAEIPAVVLAAFKLNYPNAEITETAQEMEDTVTCYEISSNDGGIIRDVLFTTDGTVIEVEQIIAAGELPEAVSKTVRATYPNGTIEQAERKVRAGVTGYEVVVKSGDKFFELALSAEGVITETEEKSTEDAD